MASTPETKTESTVFEAGDSKSLLKSFFALQEERARTYSSFANSFQAFVDDKNQEAFAKASTAAAAKFQEISKQVREIIGKIGENYSAQLQRVQELEAQKLALTVQTRQLQTKYLVAETGEFSVEYTTASRELRVKHSSLIEKINDILDELRAELIADDG